MCSIPSGLLLFVVILIVSSSIEIAIRWCNPKKLSEPFDFLQVQQLISTLEIRARGYLQFCCLYCNVHSRGYGLACVRPAIMNCQFVQNVFCLHPGMIPEFPNSGHSCIRQWLVESFKFQRKWKIDGCKKWNAVNLKSWQDEDRLVQFQGWNCFVCRQTQAQSFDTSHIIFFIISVSVCLQ